MANTLLPNLEYCLLGYRLSDYQDFELEEVYNGQGYKLLAGENEICRVRQWLPTPDDGLTIDVSYQMNARLFARPELYRSDDIPGFVLGRMIAVDIAPLVGAAVTRELLSHPWAGVSRTEIERARLRRQGDVAELFSADHYDVDYFQINDSLYLS